MIEIKKILLVDDSELIGQNIGLILTKNGYTIVTALDGEKAIHELEKDNSFDLIISDINMPTRDGISMCKELQRRDEFKNIPVFMLTTLYSSLDLKAEAKSLGIKAWIAKPVTGKQLMETIRAFEKKLNSAS
jgi:DNA-binding response OmpR family regulator